MPPLRSEIRQIIVDRLKQTPTVGGNVFSNPTTPTWREHLPAILVYTRSESIELLNQAPKEFKRDVDLAIEIVASGQEDPNKEGELGVEDILDQIAEEVEKAIIDGTDLNCKVSDLNLNGIEFEFDGAGDEPIGSARMTFSFSYYQAIPGNISEQAGVEDFNQANVDWHVGHHDSQPDLTDIEAQDQIDIPDS